MINSSIMSWLKIIRFQFYPMTWLAYTVGALYAFKSLDNFNLSIYLIGYLALFLIEFATVVSNEYYDYETDKVNKNYGPFTGGSRMLVEGKITFGQAKNAIKVSLFVALILAFILTFNYNIYSLVILSIGAFLGLAYTVPPFKLSYRSLGELDVGITHSFYIILAGFTLQVPTLDINLLWIFSIPLFFSIFGIIILGGFPDYEADKSTGKKTLVVLVGKRNASLISITSILISIVSSIIILYFNILGFLGILFLFAIFHGLGIIVLITQYMKNLEQSKIDGLLQISLAYILWFTVVPIIYLLDLF